MLDDEGLVEAIVASERNVAHRLIEEFMLLANETVAAHLEKIGMPALYRVHEEPDPLKVETFEEFISTLGYSLAGERNAAGAAPTSRSSSRRFEASPRRSRSRFCMLRTMQKARYDPANLGHFGLAAEAYTHFTSPIRRYPDLVVHRLLRESRRGIGRGAARGAGRGPARDRAAHVRARAPRATTPSASWCSGRRSGSWPTRSATSSKGYVTGVSAFGLYLELVEHFVEGMVHVSTMADDYYRFVERAHVLRGEKNGRVYRLGDRVKVQVIRVDLERRQIDLGVSEILEAVRMSESNRGPRRSCRPDRNRKEGKGSANGPDAANAPRRKRRKKPPETWTSGQAALVAAVLRRVFEVLDALADAAAKLGQAAGPKNQDDDGQDDEQLRNAQAHGMTPAGFRPDSPILASRGHAA